MKRYMFCVIFFMCNFILTSCGSESNLRADQVDVNTILVKKDGTVQASLVEEFNKKYYSKDELKDFMEQEIAKYNTKAGEEKVTISSLEVKDGIASVVFHYANIEDYAKFNNVEAKLFSASEVIEDSALPDEFIDISNNETVKKEKALESKEDLVLILKEALNITVEGKLKYYVNAAVLNPTTVEAAGEKDTIIIFK